MNVEVGAVVEGKVTGITKFGAFVALPGGKSGLVHISEVANTFVADVSEYLAVGQTVKVRVMSASPDGKINLSIKRADEPERPAAAQPRQKTAPQGTVTPPGGDSDFEDRLQRFMKESDSRIADNRMYADRPRRSNRRGK